MPQKQVPKKPVSLVVWRIYLSTKPASLHIRY